MGRASNRKKEPRRALEVAAPELPKYLDGLLDDLLVVMAFGELGYSRYHMKLATIPDYGYLLATDRLISQTGGNTHQNANDLVKLALQRPGWKRLLMLEHDHEFPPDVFRHHASYTQDIVAGMYFLRDVNNPLPVFYMWDRKRENCTIPNAEEIKQIVETAPGLYPMDCVPMGCTSIARNVLENWPPDQPYFSSYTNASGSTISPDIFFCRVAQDHGFQPYLDSRLSVDHYTLVPINKDYFVRWWNQIGAPQAIARHKEEREEQEATRGADESEPEPKSRYARVTG